LEASRFSTIRILLSLGIFGVPNNSNTGGVFEGVSNFETFRRLDFFAVDEDEEGRGVEVLEDEGFIGVVKCPLPATEINYQSFNLAFCRHHIKRFVS
jgi:hypothetical protein